MRKALSILTIVAAMGATSALAAGMTEKATGTIKSVDQSKHELTLQNGSTFNVDKSVNLASMMPGQKVSVTYTKSGKMMDATQVDKMP
jgi:hypothetical protein